jgi:hypothetical protein
MFYKIVLNYSILKAKSNCVNVNEIGSVKLIVISIYVEMVRLLFIWYLF